MKFTDRMRCIECKRQTEEGEGQAVWFEALFALSQGLTFDVDISYMHAVVKSNNERFN